MKTLSEKTRDRLHMQGFNYVDDVTLAEVGHWYRLATGMCATLVAVATAFASHIAIWAVMIFAILGAVMKRHPFDLIYHHGIRHLINGKPLPEHRLPRRFACVVATVWLLATGYAFYAGNAVLGYILGFSLTAAALIPTIVDFCIPSFILHQLSRVVRKDLTKTGIPVQETSS